MYFLVVNFHYVHEEDKYPYPGIYPTPIERMENQIKELGKHFNFISQKDIFSALDGKKILPERSCLITFDDGLSSQYKNAFPLLKKLNVPAIFFVNTFPYIENKACLVHKIHYSRANIPPKIFKDKVLNSIDKEINFPNFQKLKIKHPYSDKEEAELKYLLSEYLTDVEREMIIGRIFQEIVDDEKAWCEKYYISKKGLLNLANHSFLGIHSYSHNRLTNSSFENIKKDFERNLQTIKEITGHSLESVSYPYGQGNLLEAAKAAKSVGLKIGFTMERSLNRTLSHPFLFARIDTNDAPKGKAPIISFENEDLVLNKLISEKRNLYFTENNE